MPPNVKSVCGPVRVPRVIPSRPCIRRHDGLLRLALIALAGLSADARSARALPSEVPVAQSETSELGVAPSESVLGAIRQGRFDEALSELSKQPASAQRAARTTLDRLSYLKTLLGLVQTELRAGRSAHALQLLDTVRARAESFELAYQAGVALCEQQLLEELRRHEAPAARAALKLAGERQEAGDLAGAAAIVQQVLDAPAQHTSEVRALALQRAAMLERARTPSALWRAQAWSSLQTLLLWLVGLLVAWALLRALKAALARFPHARPVIAIEEPGVSLHKKDLPTREVIERLLSGRGGSSVAIDTIEDLDRSGLSNISLSTRDVEPLKDIASSADRISIAGLSFTPQQIYALLLPLRRPAAREFLGTLTRTPTGGSRLSIKVRAPAGVTWFVCESDTRAGALAEAADFIAFSTASWTVSRSWEGYRVYRMALRLLQSIPQGADEEAWFRVRELLESAIGYDPQNLAAQYQLGLLLRRLGQNAEAQAMLTRLQTALGERPRSASVEQFARRNPQLEASVKYDRALCFAKQDEPASLAQAEALFGELAQSDAGGAASLGRLTLLARGAIAAVVAAQAGLLPRDAEVATHRRKLYKRIAEIRQSLQKDRADPTLIDPRACSSSLAVALAAEGRALYLLGDYRRAEDALRAARAENPLLACAAINLAQVCSKRGQSKQPKLVDEAIALLERALELSPRNAKAFYLLGSIHLYGKKNHLLALSYLQRARKWNPSAITDLVYAEALHRSDNDSEALDVLQRSIREQRDPADYRYERFLHLLADWQASEPDEREWFEDLAAFADSCVRRLRDADVKPRTLARCEAHLLRIRDRCAAAPKAH